MTPSHSSNNQETETIPSQAPESAPKKSWIGCHSIEIQAFAAIGSLVATIVLALFAYLSWSEVQEQRGLAYKQFVVANAPSVRNYVEKGFKFQNEQATMFWRVRNQGGPVEDVEFKSVLLCCSGMDLHDPEATKMVIRTTKVQRINREEVTVVSIEVTDPKTIKWLKSAVDGKNAALFVYVRTKYTIPAELSLEGRSKNDEAFRLAMWDFGTKRFENVKLKARELVLGLIEKRNYLEMDEQG